MAEFLMANHKNVHCGEIFFTFERKLLIHCLLCDSTFHDYLFYLRHISEAHNLVELNKLAENVEIYGANNNTTTNPENHLTVEGGGGGGGEVLIISSENVPVESIIKFERALEQEGININVSNDNRGIIQGTAQDINSKDLRNEILQKMSNKKFGKTTAIKSTKRRKYGLKCNTEEPKVQLYGCATCPETFNTTRELSKHVKKCSVQEEKPKENIFKYECFICKSSFKEYIHLKAHRRLHVDKKINRIACPSCPKTFFTLAQLSYHQRSHTETQSLLCGVCGQSFTSMAPFLDHLHQHENHENSEKNCKEPSFKCPVCAQSFYERSHLIGHLPSHHERKEHQCSYCNAEFDRARSLKIHLKIHNDKFKYVCATCDLPFNSSARLTAHHKKKHPAAFHQSNTPDGLAGTETTNNLH